MSKAGKRMWSEKEWILGPSQSKQAAQVRAGGRGLLARKANSGSMGLKSGQTWNKTPSSNSVLQRRVWSTQRPPEDLWPENCFCHRWKGLEFSSSLLGKETVYEAHLAELNGHMKPRRKWGGPEAWGSTPWAINKHPEKSKGLGGG